MVRKTKNLYNTTQVSRSQNFQFCLIPKSVSQKTKKTCIFMFVNLIIIGLMPKVVAH